MALNKDIQASYFLISILFVFLGGAIGSSLRWITGEFISNGALVVLIVNVIGTAVAGYFAFQYRPGNQLRRTLRNAFWITGFAGGLTTFSSLSFFITELAPFEAVFFAGLNLFLSMALLGAMQSSTTPNDEGASR